MLSHHKLIKLNKKNLFFYLELFSMKKTRPFEPTFADDFQILHRARASFLQHADANSHLKMKYNILCAIFPFPFLLSSL